MKGGCWQAIFLSGSLVGHNRNNPLLNLGLEAFGCTSSEAFEHPRLNSTSHALTIFVSTILLLLKQVVLLGIHVYASAIEGLECYLYRKCR